MSQSTSEPTTENHASTKIYYQIFAALLLLLALTVGVSYVDLGVFNEVIALAIAAAKALLVLLFFMHVRSSSRVTWLFAAAGFVWLGILIALAMSDYVSRGWMR